MQPQLTIIAEAIIPAPRKPTVKSFVTLIVWRGKKEDIELNDFEPGNSQPVRFHASSGRLLNSYLLPSFDVSIKELRLGLSSPPKFRPVDDGH